MCRGYECETASKIGHSRNFGPYETVVVHCQGLTIHYYYRYYYSESKYVDTRETDLHVTWLMVTQLRKQDPSLRFYIFEFSTHKIKL